MIPNKPNQVVLRVTNKGNWGLFQWREISLGVVTRYPKCSCIHCIGHATTENLTGQGWVPLFVAYPREKVVEFAKLTNLNIVTQDEYFG